MKVQISYVHWGRVLSAVILIVFLALTLNLIADLLVFHLWSNPEQEQIATQVTETSRRKPRSFKAGRKAAFLFGEGAGLLQDRGWRACGRLIPTRGARTVAGLWPPDPHKGGHYRSLLAPLDL